MSSLKPTLCIKTYFQSLIKKKLADLKIENFDLTASSLRAQS